MINIVQIILTPSGQYTKNSLNPRLFLTYSMDEKYCFCETIKLLFIQRKRKQCQNHKIFWVRYVDEVEKYESQK